MVTVSESSRKDIAIQMGVHKSRMSVVSVGVDHTVFRPRPERPKIAGLQEAPPVARTELDEHDWM